MPAFVDTNVLVYAHDEHDRRKRDEARRLLRSLPDFVLSAQVLGEYYVTLRRKLSHVDPDDILQLVRDIAARRVIAVDARLVDRALALQSNYPISYWDALIVEAAVAGGCDTLYTEDLADGDAIRGVRIVNPFAPPTP